MLLEAGATFRSSHSQWDCCDWIDGGNRADCIRILVGGHRKHGDDLLLANAVPALGSRETDITPCRTECICTLLCVCPPCLHLHSL